ncbi:MAG: tRNA (adenosine(37)-N6)-threonylcarbamoyltransferase complex dimerization subunit type 1 TsaB [Alphaproteobacteria bacterium]
MLVLGVDSAAAGCSVAVWRDGRVLAAADQAMERGQAEALIPMVVAVMGEAGVDFGELDLIAVTVGPGSFTGVRTGLAAARALGLAAGVPVHGVTTTEAVARAVPDAERRGRPILVVLESHRADLYLQAFAADATPLGPPTSASPEDGPALVPDGPLVVAGDAAERLRPHLGERALFSASAGRPDAAVVAAIAAGRVDSGGLPPEPLYLRPPDVCRPVPAAP